MRTPEIAEMQFPVFFRHEYTITVTDVWKEGWRGLTLNTSINIISNRYVLVSVGQDFDKELIISFGNGGRIWKVK